MKYSVWMTATVGVRLTPIEADSPEDAIERARERARPDLASMLSRINPEVRGSRVPLSATVDHTQLDDGAFSTYLVEPIEPIEPDGSIDAEHARETTWTDTETGLKRQRRSSSRKIATGPDGFPLTARERSNLRKYAGIFISGGTHPVHGWELPEYCTLHIPDDIDIGDEHVATDEVGSAGWIAAPVCSVCNRSIEVIVDGTPADADTTESEVKP